MATPAHIAAADFAALLPDIAAGDLARSSIAEVLAAGWRAHATGTVAIEQGKGESRLFLRYGAPCGALLYVGFRSFGYFLLDRGLIDPEALDRTLVQAAREGRRHGEVLVREGLCTAAQLEEMLHAQHQSNLGQICLVREGRYELRGWERPPPWTEPITLDPLRALVGALQSDELFDRRRSVLDQLGSTPLRRADDFADRAARIGLQPHERSALERLQKPRPADELAENLVLREESEALVAALALLGLLEPAPAPPRSAPRIDLGVDPVSDALIDDALGASLLRPVDESAEEPEVLAPPAPIDPPPAPRAFAPGEFEFEPTGEQEEELELDLDRAPAAMQVGLREKQKKPEPRRPEPRSPERAVPSAPLPPAAGQVRRPAGRESAGDPDYNPFAVHFRPKPSTPPPARTAEQSTRELSVDERLDRALRGEVIAPPPSRPVTRPIPVERAAPAIDLDLDFVRPLTRPVPVERPALTEERGASAILADIADLVGDLSEETTGPLEIDNTPHPSQPPVDDALALQAVQESLVEDAIVDERQQQGVDAADLALELATADVAQREQPARAVLPLGEEEEDAAATMIDVDVAEPTPGAGFVLETPPEEEPPTRPERFVRPAQDAAPRVERTPLLEPDAKGDEDRAAVRRRLLQRAFANVGGSAFSREATERQRVDRAEEQVTAPQKGTQRDEELEREVQQRLARSGTDNHFQRLDLERSATTEQVKEAFLQLAKRYHPDRIGGLGQVQLLPQVRELFARVKDSYDALVDPAARARYVAELEAKEGAKKQASPEEARVAFQKALVYLKKRDLKNAEAELVRAIDADPQAEYLAELAWTLHSDPARREETKEEVRRLVVRALKTTPDHDRAYVVAAMVARFDGEAERSERFFRKALEKNPRNVEAAREVRLLDMRKGGEKKGGLFDRLRGK